MTIDLPPQYDPKSVERATYQKWLDAKVFHAVPDARPNRFSIVIPPPNVTGALHLGHAINGTIQDVLTRYHRMKGDNTLWMPGIDHAGIATQAVVEKTIFEKEKKSRHDLGREELVRRIWEWKEQFGTRILSQLQSIGASCDWDRTRFTLDDTCAKAVREAFFKMFKDGLIFRGKRLVNWDTHLQTAVADDEIYHESVKGQMTSIKYPVYSPRLAGGNAAIADNSSETEYLIVATTRPETMLGDTAVAVHPDDPRYTHLHGKFVIVPLVGRKIPVITDGLLVDPKFGTGVVKVTPAHDPNDYATGIRHNLEQINLLTPDGKVNENGAGEFLGKKYSYTGLKFATAARKQVLQDLEDLNLIADKKPHDHEVGHSDRSKTPIEPFLSDQWFVRMGDIEASPSSETRPSGSVGPQAISPAQSPTPHSTALAYFITFHTYATWLHGQEQGSVDPTQNTPDSPFIPPDPDLVARDERNLQDPPFQLNSAQRKIVHDTLHEVAAHRGWTLHAANVRSTHVHVVVSGNHAPERMMNDFKSYATRRLKEASLLADESRTWSRHGSTRYLWQPEHLTGAIRYTLDQQGANLEGTFSSPPSETRPSGSVAPQGNPDVLPHTLPHGRVSDARTTSETRPLGSVGPQAKQPDGITLANGQKAPGLAQAAMSAVLDGRVKITPDRYAKGYLDWLAQKRDWCISRQLWWGHRIPVWRAYLNYKPEHFHHQSDSTVSAEESWSIDQIRRSLDTHSPRRNPTPEEAIAIQRRIEFEANVIESIKTHFASQSLLDDISIWHETKFIYVCARTDASQRILDNFASLRTQSVSGPLSNVPSLFKDIYKFMQEEDVLDTWFSSALWPISTMGWPNSNSQSETRPSGSVAPQGNPDVLPHTLPNGRVSENVPEPELLPYFYPTSVLSTARDILTLWVARMVMFGLYCQGDIPFKNVYVHPVIQDGDGKIMSKSKGNGVDPVDIIASHGADALRFTLASLATETQDIRMPVTKDPKTGTNTSPKFDIGRNFANKIWNASRFILSNITNSPNSPHSNSPRLAGGNASPLEDRWILSRLNATIQTAENAVNTYHFAELADALRTFFWTDLCDWYLEIAKSRIKSGDATVQSILFHCLETSLKILHPLMPFITEELWSKLPDRTAMLVATPFPIADQTKNDPAAESHIALIQSIITAIREIQNRYPAAKGKPILLRPVDFDAQKIIEQSRAMIESLATVTIAENSATLITPKDAATAITLSIQIFIPGVIDKTTETAKLTKRKTELEKLIPANRAKLSNEAFVAKAPPHITQGLRDQLAKLEEELTAIEKNLQELR